MASMEKERSSPTQSPIAFLSDEIEGRSSIMQAWKHHLDPHDLPKYCHNCRKKRESNELIICYVSLLEGKEKHGAWCHRCLTRKFEYSPLRLQSALTETETVTWRCPGCENLCNCVKCSGRDEKDKDKEKIEEDKEDDKEEDRGEEGKKDKRGVKGKRKGKGRGKGKARERVSKKEIKHHAVEENKYVINEKEGVKDKYTEGEGEEKEENGRKEGKEEEKEKERELNTGEEGKEEVNGLENMSEEVNKVKMMEEKVRNITDGKILKFEIMNNYSINSSPFSLNKTFIEKEEEKKGNVDIKLFEMDKSNQSQIQMQNQNQHSDHQHVIQSQSQSQRKEENQDHEHDHISQGQHGQDTVDEDLRTCALDLLVLYNDNSNFNVEKNELPDEERNDECNDKDDIKNENNDKKNEKDENTNMHINFPRKKRSPKHRNNRITNKNGIKVNENGIKGNENGKVMHENIVAVTSVFCNHSVKDKITEKTRLEEKNERSKRDENAENDKKAEKDKTIRLNQKQGRYELRGKDKKGKNVDLDASNLEWVRTKGKRSRRIKSKKFEIFTQTNDNDDVDDKNENIIHNDAINKSKHECKSEFEKSYLNKNSIMPCTNGGGDDNEKNLHFVDNFDVQMKNDVDDNNDDKKDHVGSRMKNKDVNDIDIDIDNHDDDNYVGENSNDEDITNNGEDNNDNSNADNANVKLMVDEKKERMKGGGNAEENKMNDDDDDDDDDDDNEEKDLKLHSDIFQNLPRQINPSQGKYLAKSEKKSEHFIFWQFEKNISLEKNIFRNQKNIFCSQKNLKPSLLSQSCSESFSGGKNFFQAAKSNFKCEKENILFENEKKDLKCEKENVNFENENGEEVFGERKTFREEKKQKSIFFEGEKNKQFLDEEKKQESNFLDEEKNKKSLEEEEKFRTGEKKKRKILEGENEFRTEKKPKSKKDVSENIFEDFSFPASENDKTFQKLSLTSDSKLLQSTLETASTILSFSDQLFAKIVFENEHRFFKDVETNPCMRHHPSQGQSQSQYDSRNQSFQIDLNKEAIGMEIENEPSLKPKPQTPLFVSIQNDKKPATDASDAGKSESQIQTKPRSRKRKFLNLEGLRVEELRSKRQNSLKFSNWTPPASPFGLIQEKLYNDPWKLLVSCMLLNKTAGQQMHRVVWDLFNTIPTPEKAVEAKTEEISSIIRSLGMQNKRAKMIQRFSEEYLNGHWIDPTQLHGIGKYAADAYAIFCEGRWIEVTPDDQMLQKYVDWLRSTAGEGYGFS